MIAGALKHASQVLNACPMRQTFQAINDGELLCFSQQKWFAVIIVQVIRRFLDVRLGFNIEISECRHIIRNHGYERKLFRDCNNKYCCHTWASMSSTAIVRETQMQLHLPNMIWQTKTMAIDEHYRLTTTIHYSGIILCSRPRECREN